MEIEPGKEEVIQNRKATRSEKMQIVFLILMCLAIAALIVAVMTILKYKEMLSNPLGYNLEKFHLQSCSCLDDSGSSIFITPINKSMQLIENVSK